MGRQKDVGAVLRLLVAGAALLACAGCASTAYLDLDSDPPGADIKTQDGIRVGTTPVSVRIGSIPASAYQGTDGWAPGTTYVASKDGYEPVSWAPRLSLAGVSRVIGLPHTWNYVFVLAPVSAGSVEASRTKTKPVALSPKPAEPLPPGPPMSAEPAPVPLRPLEPAPPEAPQQAGPPVAAVSSVGKGTVSLTAEPDDAEIFVDGQFVGNSPTTLRLPEGTHVVEVKKDGLRTCRKEVHVTAESELTLRVRLLP